MDASVKYTNFLCVHLLKTTNKLVILTDAYTYLRGTYKTYTV